MENNDFRIEDFNNPQISTGFQICHTEVQKDEYLLDKLFPKQAINAIVGGSGSGKTTLAQQFAFALLNKDETFCGFRINAEYNRVMYISTEDPRYQWKKRLKKFNPDGSKDEALNSLFVIFGSIENLTGTIESILNQINVDIIILDVFSDIYTGDPNNNIAVRKFFNNYKNLSLRYGTTSVFIHHTGKGTEKNAPSKNNVLGSQAFESSMRSVIEIRPDQYDPSKRHLCILKHNYLSESEKKQSYVLKLDDDLNFSNTGQRQDLAFLSVTKQKAVDNDILLKRIMELHSAGLASRAIAEALTEQGIPIGKTKVAEIIRQMNEENTRTNESDLRESDSPGSDGPELGKIICMHNNGESRLIDPEEEDEDEDEDYPGDTDILNP